MPEDLLEVEQPTEELDGEQPAEGAEADGEQPAEGAEGEQSAEGEKEKPEVTSLFEPDGKKVAKPIREAMLKLKAENPSIGKLVMDAVFRSAEFRREFPGGLTEVRDLRDKVEQLGGFTDIEEKLQLSNELGGLAEAFENGDPAFVEDMVVSNPESFSALAPVVMDRFHEVNADAWSAYIGRIVYADLQSNDVPLYLMRLADIVRDKPEAVELLNAVNGYLGRFKTFAGKSPATAVKPKAAPSNADNQRENDIRKREWDLSDTYQRTGIIRAQYKKSLNGRNPTTEEKAQIQELFETREAKLRSARFPDWQKKLAGYISRNDRSGYLRYLASMHRSVGIEAVTSAVTSTLKDKAGATKKLAATGAAKTTIKAAAGFTVVAKEPDSYNIDYGRTSRTMLMENKAILKDGKKVMWR